MYLVARQSGPNGRRGHAVEGSDICRGVDLTRGVKVLAGGKRATIERVHGDFHRGVRRGGNGSHVIPTGRHEGHAFTFTFDDETHRDGLDTTGRAGLVDGTPQYGRDFVTHQAVEKATAFLGVHQVLVDIAGVINGALNRGRSDFVKHHALHRNLGLEHLEQVPGNGFSLAVFIAREVELVDFLERGL